LRDTGLLLPIACAKPVGMRCNISIVSIIRCPSASRTRDTRASKGRGQFTLRLPHPLVPSVKGSQALPTETEGAAGRPPATAQQSQHFLVEQECLCTCRSYRPRKMRNHAKPLLALVLLRSAPMKYLKDTGTIYWSWHRLLLAVVAKAFCHPASYTWSE